MSSSHKITDSERLAKKTNKQGPMPFNDPSLGNCWEWTGGRNEAGYGNTHTYVNGVRKKVLAHRLAYSEHIGGCNLPPDKLVCHKCNNPGCIRPSHLYLGTPADNSRDISTAHFLRKQNGTVKTPKFFKRSGLTVEEQFWLRVDKGVDCWLWIGVLSSGYGMFNVAGLRQRATRWIYEHIHNRKLLPDEKILHTCDNSTCVNPAHLTSGSQQDNIDDMIVKGRHGTTKLTDVNVRLIWRAVKDGKTCKEVGKLFSVSQSQVSNIAQGTAWKHLGLQPIPQAEIVANARAAQAKAISANGGKLTQSDVERIRALCQSKPVSVIASMFGVTGTTILRVVNRKGRYENR